MSLMIATTKKARGALAGVLATIGAVSASAQQSDASPPHAGARIAQQVEARSKPCAYPAGTRGNEVGTAVVHIWVDEKGLPTKASISSSTGSALLDAAALQCARQTTWPAALSRGKPIASETDARFEWTGMTLPRDCDAPLRRNSLFTITVRLTAEAAARVTFDKPRSSAALPGGVIGQSVICACVDESGTIQNQVKLMQESGSTSLDTKALEIGKTLDYPAGHPGCMRNAINFAAADR